MRVLGLAAAALALQGCAAWDSHGISYQGKADRLFVWKSDYSAGIGTNNGICAQGALTARAANTSADLGVSDRALSVLGTPVGQGQNSERLIDIAASQTQAVSMVNATNAQTAYANIAYFYLCQIALNQQLDGSTIQTMWRDTSVAIAHIGASEVRGPLTPSPANLPTRVGEGPEPIAPTNE
ncbi:hypothetical protein [Brevundimonas sp.]|uniref:hypothetical protein n=1 Tax=Brevundimonas sp. TaxID=1871086 RepID=UPI0035AE50AD